MNDGREINAVFKGELGANVLVARTVNNYQQLIDHYTRLVFEIVEADEEAFRFTAEKHYNYVRKRKQLN
jgi:hypothetical protein